jgi:hypothetical protein
MGNIITTMQQYDDEANELSFTTEPLITLEPHYDDEADD